MAGSSWVGFSDRPHFRTLDIAVGWWVSGKFATCLAAWCKMGVLPPVWCCCPRSLMALCHLPESKKESCPFSIKNKPSFPKLVSWQELGAMKESQLFPCPFQRWGSHIPTLGPSAVAMLTEWQSPWYSSASCSCSWEGGREVTGRGGSGRPLWDCWWSERVLCHFCACLEILGLEGNELSCCAWLGRNWLPLAEGWP